MLSWAFAAVETITLAALGPKWVGLVVCLLPVVGDRECSADGGIGAGFLPCLAVVAVPGHGPAGHDDESGVGVDEDLVVGEVPIVLRVFGDGVVARCVVPGRW